LFVLGDFFEISNFYEKYKKLNCRYSKVYVVVLLAPITLPRGSLLYDLWFLD